MFKLSFDYIEEPRVSQYFLLDQIRLLMESNSQSWPSQKQIIYNGYTRVKTAQTNLTKDILELDN